MPSGGGVHSINTMAVARKLAVRCRQMLTKEEDYLWAHPALVANWPTSAR